MRKFTLSSLLLLAMFLLVCGCYGDGSSIEAATYVYVVDVEKVLQDSKAAKAGNDRLLEAGKILEKGYADLREAYKNVPDDKKNPTLQGGAQALNQQMAAEKQAVIQVITKMMLEEIKKWRKAHKANVVMPKAYTLDADPEADITAEIIKAMNKKEAKFPDLPTVRVVKPENAQSDTPKENKKSTKR